MAATAVFPIWEDSNREDQNLTRYAGEYAATNMNDFAQHTLHQTNNIGDQRSAFALQTRNYPSQGIDYGMREHIGGHGTGQSAHQIYGQPSLNHLENLYGGVDIHVTQGELAVPNPTYGTRLASESFVGDQFGYQTNYQTPSLSIYNVEAAPSYNSPYFHNNHSLQNHLGSNEATLGPHVTSGRVTDSEADLSGSTNTQHGKLDTTSRQLYPVPKFGRHSLQLSGHMGVTSSLPERDNNAGGDEEMSDGKFLSTSSNSRIHGVLEFTKRQFCRRELELVS
jgi:hypothetical protein